MDREKTLSGKVAKAKVDLILRDLRRSWKKAGFLSDNFDNEIRSFKRIVLDEISSIYNICENGC